MSFFTLYDERFALPRLPALPVLDRSLHAAYNPTCAHSPWHTSNSASLRLHILFAFHPQPLGQPATSKQNEADD